MIAFPNTHHATHWTSIVLQALTQLTRTAGEEIRHREVIAYLESLPGFPGWTAWGSGPMGSNRIIQRGHRAVSLAADRLKAAGRITSPRRGYFVVANEPAPPAPKPLPQERKEIASIPSLPADIGLVIEQFKAHMKGLGFTGTVSLQID